MLYSASKNGKRNFFVGQMGRFGPNPEVEFITIEGIG